MEPDRLVVYDHPAGFVGHQQTVPDAALEPLERSV